MRNLILLSVSFILVLSSASFPEDSIENSASEKLTPKTLEELFESGNRTVALFYTTKSCKCTNERCKAARTDFEDYSVELDENYTYITIDISADKDIAKTYKIFAVPALIIFDSDGQELARLNHPDISSEKLKEQLSMLERLKEQPKTTNIQESE
ncbi:thioredoxin family protein [bacterium]|nr:thioredoxin family protein [bacterium]